MRALGQIAICLGLGVFFTVILTGLFASTSIGFIGWPAVALSTFGMAVLASSFVKIEWGK